MCKANSIEEVVEVRRQETARAYFVAAWTGESAETLLDRGTAAGRTPTEVQADLDAAARARKLIEETGHLAEARWRLSRAEAQHAKADGRLKAAVLRLRPRAEAAGFAVEDARQAVAAAETAARDLLSTSPQKLGAELLVKPAAYGRACW